MCFYALIFLKIFEKSYSIATEGSARLLACLAESVCATLTAESGEDVAVLDSEVVERFPDVFAKLLIAGPIGTADQR